MIPVLDLGFLQIPTFFLVISLSVSGLLLYLSKKVDSFHKDRKHAFNIALILMISGFLGGRLLHVFYEDFNYYKMDPEQIFYFWNGGFVFYGGFILGWLSTWVYSRIKKISFLEWADFFAPLLSLSHALGRIGCVLSGCCYGQYCDLPWAVSGSHPTATYLFFGELLIFFVLLRLEKLQILTKSQHAGHLFFKWLFLHSFLRYVVEFYRNDFRGATIPVPFVGAATVSQFICLILMIICLVFFVKFRKQK